MEIIQVRFGPRGVPVIETEILRSLKLNKGYSDIVHDGCSKYDFSRGEKGQKTITSEG